MEQARFLNIAKDWGVDQLISDNALKDNGEVLSKAEKFSEVDWQATSLKLAEELKRSVGLNAALMKQAEDAEDLIDGYEERLDDSQERIRGLSNILAILGKSI